MPIIKQKSDNKTKWNTKEQKTRFEMKEKFDPNKLPITMKNVKNWRNGSFLNCSNKYTIEKITEKVERT